MDRLKAKDVMTAPACAVRAETPLEEVAKLLAERHISGVPVVDEQGHVIGIVTEADLIDEHKREWLIPRTALYGLFPIPEDLLMQTYEGGRGLTAGDVMTKKVTTALEETPFHELADMMVMRHISRVPIVRERKLVGVVCRGDLVRALAEKKGGSGR